MGIPLWVFLEGRRESALCVGMQASRVTVLTCVCPAEHSGLLGGGDYNTDMDSYSKEQAFCPQPVARDSRHPSMRSSQEPSRSPQDHSPHHLTTETVEGSLYPSNHDRMPKKKLTAPLDGKGRGLLCSGELHGMGWGWGEQLPPSRRL